MNSWWVLVEHYTEDNGVVGWYRGTVTGVKKGSKYFIRYDGFQRVYSYSKSEVSEDLDSLELKLLSVDPEYPVGREISHLWVLEDGEEEWCKGFVVNC